MGYIIERLREQALVRIRLLNAIKQAELLSLSRDLHQYLNKTEKTGRLFLAIHLKEASFEDEQVLITLIQSLNMVYRRWQHYYQMEFLLVVETSLLAILRHLADIEGFPSHFFIECDTLRTYIAIQLDARDKLITYAKGTSLLQNHSEVSLS